VRRAVLEQVIEERRTFPVCLGVRDGVDGRLRNPSPTLLSALQAKGKVLPIGECIDEEDGQRQSAVYIEAQDLDWLESEVAELTVDVWSSSLPTFSAAFRARENGAGLWDVERRSAE